MIHIQASHSQANTIFCLVMPEDIKILIEYWQMRVKVWGTGSVQVRGAIVHGPALTMARYFHHTIPTIRVDICHQSHHCMQNYQFRQLLNHNMYKYSLTWLWYSDFWTSVSIAAHILRLNKGSCDLSWINQVDSQATEIGQNYGEKWRQMWSLMGRDPLSLAAPSVKPYLDPYTQNQPQRHPHHQSLYPSFP